MSLFWLVYLDSRAHLAGWTEIHSSGEPFDKVQAVELLGSEEVDAFEDVPR